MLLFFVIKKAKHKNLTCLIWRLNDKELYYNFVEIKDSNEILMSNIHCVYLFSIVISESNTDT